MDHAARHALAPTMVATLATALVTALVTTLVAACDAPAGATAGPDAATSPDAPAGPGDAAGGAPPTRIYATVVSHNEEDSNAACKSGPNHDPAKYAANRALLRQLAEGVVARGAAYDHQDEWLWLSRVADPTYETPALQAETGGKNIVAYLAGLDPARVSIDVHHHPSGLGGENHADVAGRLAQLGVTEHGVVGGFLFAPAQSAEVDAMRGYATTGMVSTKAWGGVRTTWRPRVLWGGGTAGHTGDSPASGVWRPASNAAFYVDDPTSPLPNVGHYQGNLDFTGLTDLLAAYQAGALPAGRMYTVTLMVNQCELTADGVAAVLAAIDRAAPAVAAGYLAWRTIPAIVDEWRDVYGSAPQLYGAP